MLHGVEYNYHVCDSPSLTKQQQQQQQMNDSCRHCQCVSRYKRTCDEMVMEVQQQRRLQRLTAVELVSASFSQASICSHRHSLSVSQVAESYVVLADVLACLQSTSVTEPATRLTVMLLLLVLLSAD